MKPKLTRRQFSRLAIAGTTVAALGTFASKGFSQSSPIVMLGVGLGNITSPNSTNTNQIINTNTAVTSTIQPIVEKSFNMVSSAVQILQTPTAFLGSDEQISGFTSMMNGTQVIAATNVNPSYTGDQLTRLIFLGASPKTQTLYGLTNHETLVNLTVLKDGSLVGLAANKNGVLPIKLVSINPESGEITENPQNWKLPEDQRVTQIVECPDGSLYAITVGQKGETSLVQLNQGQTKLLSFNNQVWNSGLSSLVCSPDNQLIALGARRYESPKYLHTIDQNTGVLTRLSPFDVASIAIQKS